MAVSSVSSNPIIQIINRQQNELQRLQIQLGTGQRATNYADIGGRRSAALDARAKLADFEGFDQTISTLNLRLTVVQSTLTRFSAITSAQRGANVTTSFTPVDGTQTAQQRLSLTQLDEVIDLLNQNSGGRQLFSGRQTDAEASLSSADILGGVGGRAGLRDVIIERNRADLGADGFGRLQQQQTGNTVTLSETASGDFGLKIAGTGGSLTNATVTNAAGPPVSASIDFTGVPRFGEALRLTFNLPDGTTAPVTLTAVAGTPRAGEFQVGSDAATTATNFNTALNAAVRGLAQSDLRAASTIAASDGFFDVSDGPPAKTPTRVDLSNGPPEQATQTLTTGTDGTTVTWYTGDAGTTPARQTSAVRIDNSVTVGYGIRATEPAFRTLVSGLAAFAAAQFDPSQSTTLSAYTALSLRTRDKLGDTSGQTIATIGSEIAVVQQSASATKTRQTGTRTILENLVSDIESISKEEVATQILELQTRLQASYQTTSRISQLSLVNFLN